MQEEVGVIELFYGEAVEKLLSRRKFSYQAGCASLRDASTNSLTCTVT
jgi:hypothetical protein